MENIKEVIEICLEESEENNNSMSINKFVGV